MENSEKHKYFVKALELLQNNGTVLKGICNYLSLAIPDKEAPNYFTIYWELKDYLWKYLPKEPFDLAYFFPLTVSGKAKRIKLLKKIIKDLEKSL